MILIKNNWEEVRYLQDAADLVRYYYHSELANEIEKLIPWYTNEDYYELLEKVKDLENENENIKDENYYLDSQNDELRAQIEELEDRLNSWKDGKTSMIN